MACRVYDVSQAHDTVAKPPIIRAALYIFNGSAHVLSEIHPHIIRPVIKKQLLYIYVGHVFKFSIMCVSNVCPLLFMDTVFYLMCVVSRNVWAVVKMSTLCWKLFCYSDLYSRYCCIIDVNNVLAHFTIVSHHSCNW